MNNEAISMCKHLTSAVVRGDVNGQYHWANLIMLDALANGAKGPEAQQHDGQRLTDEQASALFAQMNADRANWTPDKEAQAQRIADAASVWAARLAAEDAIEEARR